MTFRLRLRQVLALALLLSIARTLSAGKGVPERTCPDAAAVDARDTRRVQAHLADMLEHSTFFSVFSVALDKPCPFWEEDPMCVIRECTVCHCEDSEVPPVWLREDANGADCRDGETCTKQGDKLNNVDRSLTGLAALVGQPVWHTADADSWTVRDEEPDMMYVDLRKNPEQYTGYSGPSSRRVWEAVYDENCFTFSDKCRSGICDLDTCKEERVLYTLISGLHASISMHIAKRYLSGGRWGVNTSIYRDRIRDHPERIANLNLAFAVVLRAVSKASSALHPRNYSYVTGNESNDKFTRDAMANLFELPILQPGCEDKVFDESDMFLQKNEYLLPEFRNAFRNISMIMDCVGCEKCRLWGKLQFLGLGTALRILFEDDTPELERNELIALINVLFKLSSSVMWVERMDAIIRRDASINAMGGGFIAFVILVLIALKLRVRKSTARTMPSKQGAIPSKLQREQNPDGRRGEKRADPLDSTSDGNLDEAVSISPQRSEHLRNRRVAQPE